MKFSKKYIKKYIKKCQKLIPEFSQDSDVRIFQMSGYNVGQTEISKGSIKLNEIHTLYDIVKDFECNHGDMLLLEVTDSIDYEKYLMIEIETWKTKSKYFYNIY